MTGTNAESFSAPSFMTPFSLARRSRLIHLCNRFAFTPCESARLAIDTPGCKHASTSRLFACGSNIRLPSRFTLIIAGGDTVCSKSFQIGILQGQDANQSSRVSGTTLASQGGQLDIHFADR